MRLTAVFCLAAVLFLFTPARAHDNAQGQPLSPRGQATFRFDDGKTIVVDYGRPFIRGRKIMGGLVPFNQIWRTGANAATGFVTDAPLVFGGKNLPAGKYTLYSIPGAQQWTIVVNRQTGQWGTKYDPTQDAIRVTATPKVLPQPVDQFTISFDKQGANAGVMKLEWENTSVPVDFSEAKP